MASKSSLPKVLYEVDFWHSSLYPFSCHLKFSTVGLNPGPVREDL